MIVTIRTHRQTDRIRVDDVPPKNCCVQFDMVFDPITTVLHSQQTLQVELRKISNGAH